MRVYGDRTSFYACASNFRKTLNSRLPIQNSSDFDKKVCALIALTSSVVLAILRVGDFFLFFGRWEWGGVEVEVEVGVGLILFSIIIFVFQMFIFLTFDFSFLFVCRRMDGRMCGRMCGRIFVRMYE